MRVPPNTCCPFQRMFSLMGLIVWRVWSSGSRKIERKKDWLHSSVRSSGNRLSSLSLEESRGREVAPGFASASERETMDSVVVVSRQKASIDLGLISCPLKRSRRIASSLKCLRGSSLFYSQSSDRDKRSIYLFRLLLTF